MRFEETEPILSDFRHLSAGEQSRFIRAVQEMNQAYANRGSARLPRWPAHLRVKAVEGSHGIWEMTWSFAGPDGRATFEYVDIAGEPAIRWRRIGDHRILREP